MNQAVYSSGIGGSALEKHGWQAMMTLNSAQFRDPHKLSPQLFEDLIGDAKAHIKCLFEECDAAKF